MRNDRGIQSVIAIKPREEFIIYLQYLGLITKQMITPRNQQQLSCVN